MNKDLHIFRSILFMLTQNKEVTLLWSKRRFSKIKHCTTKIVAED